MQVPLDKQAHFWLGLAIAATLTSYGVSPRDGFWVGVLVGGVKELIDPYLKGQRDAYDFIATVLGAAGVLPLLLF